MTTLIDSLVVSLGLDATGFKKGEKETVNSLRNLEGQSQKTSTEIEAHGKRAAEAFGRIRNQVLALTAAVLGAKGIVDFTEKLTATDAATGRLAKNLNMSTQDLAAWEGAVKRTGGTADGMAGSLQSLTSQLQELHTTGNAPFLVPLARAGVDMAKFLNDATPMTEKMLELSDAFSKLSPQKAQYLGAGIGLDQGTINLLIQGRPAVEAYLAAQQKMASVSKADTDAAKARQNAWVDLQDTFVGVGRSIETDLTPAIVGVLREMQQWIQANKGWIESDIGGAIKAFIQIEEAATKATGGWALATEALFALWLGAKFVSVLANVSKLAGLGIGVGRSLAGLGLTAATGAAVVLQHGDVADNAPTDYKPGALSQGAPFENFIRKTLGMSPAYNRQLEADYLGKFMGMGYTKAQASGLVANIMTESMGDPTAVGDGGKAYGLGQWHADRQKLFAQQFGHDIQHSTADEQLKFYNWELHNTEIRAGRMLQATNDPGKAGSIVSSMDERPYDALGESYRRAALARGIAADPSLITGAGAAAGSTIPSVKGGSTSKTDVSIGTITVNTPATNAKGISQDIGLAMQRYAFSSNANAGLR